MVQLVILKVVFMKSTKTPHSASQRKKLVHCISLGCSRNLVDSEIMLGLLQENGFSLTPILTNADFIIVNTCGFLESSRKESLQTIRAVISHKKGSAKVIVTGCLAQLQGPYLEPLKKDIHYIIGSGDIPSILKAVSSADPGEEVTSAQSFLEQGDTPRTLSTPSHYAYVKIAEGCMKRCSYCIIPTIKGSLKSKPIAQVVDECDRLVQQGVFELIFIAQDLGDYGKDLGFKGSSGLVHVLREVLSLKKDFRIRLLYVYPDEISDELIDLMKSDSRIIPYLDMPIQHINDQLLRSMKRATSKEHICKTIRALREKIPSVSIRTSLIAGFPGETEEIFQELCDFVGTGALDNVGIFAYSKETASASAELPGHIKEQIKKERVAKLASIQKKNVLEAHKKRIGTTVPVMIDGYHPETQLLLVGRMINQCPEIDPAVLINEFEKVQSFGNVYLVEITDVSDYDLLGKVLNPLKRAEWL
jgi:ribosomal protein S12 methylthiotransferase